MADDEIDDLSLRFALQLQLDELTALERSPERPDAPDARSDLELVMGLYRQDLEAERGRVPGPHASPATYNGGEQQQQQPEEQRQCTACGDAHAASSLARCPCSHEYCRGCLARLFERATADESLFPPRCCQQPVRVDDHAAALPPELVARFRARELEMSTPVRVYCHRRECAAFVPPQAIEGDVATCGRCRARTCAVCGGAEHERECPSDEAAQGVLRLAREEGWQRCYRCHRLVELDFGCFHIVCVCKAEFCYVCGAQWRTCACPRWEEDILYDQVARDLQIPQDVYHRPDCVERVLINHAGGQDCELCHSTAADHVHAFECMGCHMVVCWRCRLYDF